MVGRRPMSMRDVTYSLVPRVNREKKFGKRETYRGFTLESFKSKSHPYSRSRFKVEVKSSPSEIEGWEFGETYAEAAHKARRLVDSLISSRETFERMGR